MDARHKAGHDDGGRLDDAFAMSLTRSILMRMFGRPEGFLGRSARPRASRGDRVLPSWGERRGDAFRNGIDRTVAALSARG